MSRPIRFGTIILAALLVNCATSGDHERRRLAAMEIEKGPGGKPTVVARGLRDPANRVPIDARAPVKAQNVNCPSDIQTFVRNEQGTNCDTYQAEIAG